MSTAWKFNLEDVPGWDGDEREISRTLTFRDFVAAMSFVNKVAEVAEREQHHPDIDIRYNRVKLALTTHDAGGRVTEKDARMAQRISELYRQAQ